MHLKCDTFPRHMLFPCEDSAPAKKRRRNRKQTLGEESSGASAKIVSAAASADWKRERRWTILGGRGIIALGNGLAKLLYHCKGEGESLMSRELGLWYAEKRPFLLLMERSDGKEVRGRVV